MKLKLSKFNSKSSLYLFVILGGLYIVIGSIQDGDILLKGSVVTVHESPFYFWLFIFFICSVICASVKWFVESLK
jgi:hypothetical protein